MMGWRDYTHMKKAEGHGPWQNFEVREISGKKCTYDTTGSHKPRELFLPEIAEKKAKGLDHVRMCKAWRWAATMPTEFERYWAYECLAEVERAWLRINNIPD